MYNSDLIKKYIPVIHPKIIMAKFNFIKVRNYISEKCTKFYL